MRDLADDHLLPALEVTPHLLSAFEVLALTPPEYIPRHMHIDFLKRGCAADVAVALSIRDHTAGFSSPRHLVVIRETLHRIIGHLGSLETNVCGDAL